MRAAAFFLEALDDEDEASERGSRVGNFIRNHELSIVTARSFDSAETDALSMNGECNGGSLSLEGEDAVTTTPAEDDDACRGSGVFFSSP